HLGIELPDNLRWRSRRRDESLPTDDLVALNATPGTSTATVGGVLLDAHQVLVLPRHVVLRAAQDQSAQRQSCFLNVMEVLILLLGTGRDHGLGTPADVPDDCRRGD